MCTYTYYAILVSIELLLHAPPGPVPHRHSQAGRPLQRGVQVTHGQHDTRPEDGKSSCNTITLFDAMSC